jgi:hypothetical protein
MRQSILFAMLILGWLLLKSLGVLPLVEFADIDFIFGGRRIFSLFLRRNIRIYLNGDFNEGTISTLKIQFNQEIAKVSSEQELADLDTKYLGRKAGLLTNILRGLKDLSVEEKKIVGPLANQLKEEMEGLIKEQQFRLKGLADNQTIDVTLPGRGCRRVVCIW